MYACIGLNRFKGLNIIMIITGLCILSLSSPQLYHIVKDVKSWTEAQHYCREKYTDLVTINSEKDMVRVSDMLDHSDEVWIGLYGSHDSWKWSLQRKGFYGEKEDELRLWAVSEPNDLNGDFVCADLSTYGKWADYDCYGKRKFICYYGEKKPIK